MLDGGREDQLWQMLKVILVKLPKEREEKRRRKIWREDKRDLGKYRIEKKARQETVRMGSGGGPRPMQVQTNEMDLEKLTLL